ncbi:MAG: tripartite tricarboxylate transporter TctB family protein [Bacillota bacterium]
MPKIRYVPTISILFGIYWLVLGVTKYGLWQGTSPGAGFLPAIVGAMLIGFSIWILTTPAVYKAGSMQRKAFFPVLLSVAALAAVYVIGMILAMGAYVIFWLRHIEKLSVKKSVVIGLSATIFIYYVFRVWLMVPFPKGLLGLI